MPCVQKFVSVFISVWRHIPTMWSVWNTLIYRNRAAITDTQNTKVIKKTRILMIHMHKQNQIGYIIMITYFAMFQFFNDIIHFIFSILWYNQTTIIIWHHFQSKTENVYLNLTLQFCWFNYYIQWVGEIIAYALSLTNSVNICSALRSIPTCFSKKLINRAK